MRKIEDYESKMVHNGKRNEKFVLLPCEHCGEMVWKKWHSRIKRGDPQYCNKECYNNWQRDKSERECGKENASFNWDGERWIAYWRESGEKKSTTKSKWLWEQNYGEVPDGYWVTYKDENPENCELDNLKLISRGKRMSRAMMGHKHSEETKQKLSEAHSGKVLSDEHKKNIGKATKQMWEDGVFDASHIREAYARQGRATKGTKHSEKTKKKLSKIRREMFSNPERRRMASETMKKVWSNPKEHKKRVKSLRQRYKDNPEIRDKISNALKGRDFTDEHRERLSIAGQNRDDLKGENSIWWKGGVSDQPYPSEFTDYLRSKIRRRDNHECQCCKENVYRSKRGHVHHIDGNKQDCSENNLVLTCASCHGAIHGRSNLTSDKIEYYKSLLKC